MDEEVADAVGITDYELVALIDMDATPEGTRVLEALGLADLLSNDTAVRAGYASLLVRGMADADDEGIAAGAVRYKRRDRRAYNCPSPECRARNTGEWNPKKVSVVSRVGSSRGVTD